MFRPIKQPSSGPTRTFKQTTEYCTECGDTWTVRCVSIYIFLNYNLKLWLWLKTLKGTEKRNGMDNVNIKNYSEGVEDNRLVCSYF
jgi:hypothetical protein